MDSTCVSPTCKLGINIKAEDYSLMISNNFPNTGADMDMSDRCCAGDGSDACKCEACVPTQHARDEGGILLPQHLREMLPTGDCRLLLWQGNEQYRVLSHEIS